jgi:hypothetical protein
VVVGMAGLMASENCFFVEVGRGLKALKEESSEDLKDFPKLATGSQTGVSQGYAV